MKVITVDCESNPDYPRYCNYDTLGYDFVVNNKDEKDMTQFIKEAIISISSQ